MEHKKICAALAALAFVAAPLPKAEASCDIDCVEKSAFVCTEPTADSLSQTQNAVTPNCVFTEISSPPDTSCKGKTTFAALPQRLLIGAREQMHRIKRDKLCNVKSGTVTDKHFPRAP